MRIRIRTVIYASFYLIDSLLQTEIRNQINMISKLEFQFEKA